MDATVEAFLQLSPASNLEDFIHDRNFTGEFFQKVKLTPPVKNLNKTVYRVQTEKLNEGNCRNKNSCLVWILCSLRSSSLVLVAPTFPVLSTSVTTPESTVPYAGEVVEKCPEVYLQNGAWISALKATVKVVGFVAVDETMVEKAKCLLLALHQRLDIHISDRVDDRGRHHWTLDFLRDNIASIVAAKCLIGHIADHLESYRVHECLLVMTKEDASEEVFQSISKHPEGLGTLEGCYLRYDTKNEKCIRSDNSLGVGNNE